MGCFDNIGIELIYEMTLVIVISVIVVIFLYIIGSHVINEYVTPWVNDMYESSNSEIINIIDHRIALFNDISVSEVKNKITETYNKNHKSHLNNVNKKTSVKKELTDDISDIFHILHKWSNDNDIDSKNIKEENEEERVILEPSQEPSQEPLVFA